VIIDTHCHLNFNLFEDDLSEVLDRARSVGVGRIVVPATDLATSYEAISLSHRIPEIFAAVGIHPNDCQSFAPSDIEELRTLAGDPKVVAIGEIGLDTFHKDVELDQQITVFQAQLDIAMELDLPVLIHNRDADDAILPILENWILMRIKNGKNTEIPGILHAFSSSMAFARSASDLGFYFGAAGPITYKNADDKRNIFRSIDRNKVVLETDSPFLAPNPKRGRRNEPAFTQFIANELAAIWDISVEKVQEITTKNAARIFQWTNL